MYIVISHSPASVIFFSSIYASHWMLPRKWCWASWNNKVSTKSKQQMDPRDIWTWVEIVMRLDWPLLSGWLKAYVNTRWKLSKWMCCWQKNIHRMKPWCISWKQQHGEFSCIPTRVVQYIAKYRYRDKSICNIPIAGMCDTSRLF